MCVVGWDVFQGYVRVFAGYSQKWAGGVSTLVEYAGGETYGTIFRFTDAEKARLDESMVCGVL